MTIFYVVHILLLDLDLTFKVRHDLLPPRERKGLINETPIKKKVTDAIIEYKHEGEG